MITSLFREVRPAIDRGFNEVDEVDRPRPGGAGCALLFPTCVDAVLGGQQSPHNSSP